MTEQNKPVSFWKALIGTCCGTAIFFRLRYNSWLRTCWHLLLMALLCALGIVWGVHSRLKAPFAATEAEFSRDFGTEIRFAADGIFPLNNPDRGRMLPLPHHGMLFYLPSGQGIRVPAEDLAHLDYAMVWTPLQLMMALRYDRNAWQITSQQAEDAAGSRPNPMAPGVHVIAQKISDGDFSTLLAAGIPATGQWPWPG